MTAASSQILANKKAVIFGVANKRSLAYGIAQSYINHGAEVIITYQNERLQKRAYSLAENLGCSCFPCDVLNEQDIAKTFEHIEKNWGKIDILVHSIAYALTEDMANPFHQTSRQGFRTAFETSVYSFIQLADTALPLMKKDGGSIITLTFSGSNKVMPSYKIMGPAKAALESSMRYLAYELGQFNITVNAISAGPIKTLSSSVMPKFNDVLKLVEEKAPLHTNVSQEDVGELAVFLGSKGSNKVTGNILYVDSGTNIMGI